MRAVVAEAASTEIPSPPLRLSTRSFSWACYYYYSKPPYPPSTDPNRRRYHLATSSSYPSSSPWLEGYPPLTVTTPPPKTLLSPNPPPYSSNRGEVHNIYQSFLGSGQRGRPVSVALSEPPGAEVPALLLLPRPSTIQGPLHPIPLLLQSDHICIIRCLLFFPHHYSPCRCCARWCVVVVF